MNKTTREWAETQRSRGVKCSNFQRKEADGISFDTHFSRGIVLWVTEEVTSGLLNELEDFMNFREELAEQCATGQLSGMLRVENMKNHVNLRLEEFADITISCAGQSIKVDKEEFSRLYDHLAMEPMRLVPNIKRFLGAVKRK